MVTSITCKVSVSMTAYEWELYTSMKGVGDVATKLSSAASKAINEAHKVYAATNDKEAASKAALGIWDSVSRNFSNFGANDTEPRYHFESLMVKLFYKPHNIEYHPF